MARPIASRRFAVPASPGPGRVWHCANTLRHFDAMVPALNPPIDMFHDSRSQAQSLGVIEARG